MRVGIGYDIHKLVEHRDLIIGGVKIPHEKGLLGHSDADVLVHAICDALLGACGESDIGTYFPDTLIKYKDISSLELLGEVNRIINSKNYIIINIDSVIIAESPKFISYIQQMKENISSVLNISNSLIGIKASTNEGLGSLGNSEGIAAHAAAILDTKL
ncbi:2-C-methyl-D-erythritol 2,4-cyclodiphosphate synthase [bacterium]